MACGNTGARTHILSERESRSYRLLGMEKGRWPASTTLSWTHILSYNSRRYAMTTDTALASNADLFAGIVEGEKKADETRHDRATSSNVPKCSLIDFEQIKKASGFNR